VLVTYVHPAKEPAVLKADLEQDITVKNKNKILNITIKFFMANTLYFYFLTLLIYYKIFYK
jgi:hypothetical protein